MNMHRKAKLTALSRAEMIKRIVDLHQPVARVALGFGISERCASTWLARFRAEGAAGLCDRSSRPKSSPRTTHPLRVARVLALRRRKLPGFQIARATKLAKATVSRLLRRHRFRLAQLSPMKPLTALWPSSIPPSPSSRTMAFKPSAFTPITAPVIALALCAIPWPPSASNIASPAPIPLRPMARPSALSKLPCASGLMLTPPPISAQIASRLSFTTTTGIVLITPSNSALPSPDSPST